MNDFELTVLRKMKAFEADLKFDFVLVGDEH